MKLLVTGGLGFIGSHVVRNYLEKGYEINILDDFSNSQPDLDFFDNSNISCSQKGESIVDQKIVDHWAKDCEGIIHLAAKIDVQESMQIPEEYVETNIRGTFNVLEAARKRDIPVIFMSSASVYGEKIDEPGVKETDLTEPLSIYGGTKLAAENLMNSYASGYSLPCTNLRLFNVYGSGQSKHYAGVISVFMGNAIKNETIQVFGDGEQTRDFVYVKDVVQAINLALEKKTTGTFNIGSGFSVTINDLIETLKGVFNQDLEINYQKERKGDIKNSAVDISKAKNELKFNPKYNLERGLKEMLKHS